MTLPCPPSPPATLADLSRAKDLFIWPSFSQGLENVAGILLVLGGLLLLVVGWWFLRDFRQPGRAHPWWTYHRLAGQLGLGLGDRHLLARIARRQKLPTPLALLLSPATLRYHAQAYAETRSVLGRARVLRRVDGLVERLFGRA